MNITFLQARNYTPGRKLPISLIVLHVMEWPEKPTAAAGCAYMFAGEKSPKASAHYCVDSNQIYQCVKDEDTAWHAKGGDANARGIGIELAGYAKQSAEEWSDLYSEKMLDRAASLVASLCAKYNIPASFVEADDLIASLSGITTHHEVTKAFKVVGGHTDPGPNFPMKDFLIKVESYLAYPEE